MDFWGGGGISMRYSLRLIKKVGTEEGIAPLVLLDNSLEKWKWERSLFVEEGGHGQIIDNVKVL